MKQETAVLIAKGVCYAGIGGLTPLATGLGQWANEGLWPPGINWVVILAGAAVGMCTQVLSFLSQSYGNYKIEMKSNGSAPTPPPPT